MATWLELETAIEIIGDMIADTHNQIINEEEKESPDSSLIKGLEDKIIGLGRERRLAYLEDTAVIAKAYSEYGPYLKAQKAKLLTPAA